MTLRGCSHSLIFRPPSLLPPRSFPPLAFLSDMLAVRIGQLTAEVFHLLDLQPCWLLRRLYHLVLAFPIKGDVTNSRAPLLHGRYPTSSLTDPSATLSPSIDFPV